MTPIGTDEELIEHARELRRKLNDTMPNGVGNTIDAILDALQSRISEIERLKLLIAEMDKQVDDCCGCLGHVEPEFRARIDAALSQHRTTDLAHLNNEALTG